MAFGLFHAPSAAKRLGLPPCFMCRLRQRGPKLCPARGAEQQKAPQGRGLSWDDGKSDQRLENSG